MIEDLLIFASAFCFGYFIATLFSCQLHHRQRVCSQSLLKPGCRSMNNMTTCAGETCARKSECIRHTTTEEHEVTRLCYSGYSFFQTNLLPVFFEEPTDD